MDQRACLQPAACLQTLHQLPLTASPTTQSFLLVRGLLMCTVAGLGDCQLCCGRSRALHWWANPPHQGTTRSEETPSTWFCEIFGKMLDVPSPPPFVPGHMATSLTRSPCLVDIHSRLSNGLERRWCYVMQDGVRCNSSGTAYPVIRHLKKGRKRFAHLKAQPRQSAHDASTTVSLLCMGTNSCSNEEKGP